MNTLYVNQKAKKSRRVIIILFACISVLSFEGLRAGLTTHLTGVTPKLFGLVNTSPIDPQTALHWIIPSAFMLCLFFMYMLLQAIWRGVLLNITIEDNIIMTLNNGLSNKKLSYDMKKIKKISYKTESSTIGASATVTASGTTVVTERLYIHLKSDNEKIKKVNLVSGEKKEIRAIGKELKTMINLL